MYHKKCHSASTMNGAILNIGLIGQVIRWIDGDLHSLHGQKSSKICCVWGDDYKSKSPPKRHQQTKRERKNIRKWKPIAVQCNIVWWLQCSSWNEHQHVRTPGTCSYSPDPADAACGESSGHDLWSLLHKTPNRKPQAVSQCILILQQVSALT